MRQKEINGVLWDIMKGVLEGNLNKGTAAFMKLQRALKASEAGIDEEMGVTNLLGRRTFMG